MAEVILGAYGNQTGTGAVYSQAWRGQANGVCEGGLGQNGGCR